MRCASHVALDLGSPSLQSTCALVCDSAPAPCRARPPPTRRRAQSPRGGAPNHPAAGLGATRLSREIAHAAAAIEAATQSKEDADAAAARAREAGKPPPKPRAARPRRPAQPNIVLCNEDLAATPCVGGRRSAVGAARRPPRSPSVGFVGFARCRLRDISLRSALLFSLLLALRRIVPRASCASRRRRRRR